jgi:hypothetical protein
MNLTNHDVCRDMRRKEIVQKRKEAKKQELFNNTDIGPETFEQARVFMWIHMYMHVCVCARAPTRVYVDTFAQACVDRFNLHVCTHTHCTAMCCFFVDMLEEF